jgi:hypothetical protein
MDNVQKIITLNTLSFKMLDMKSAFWWLCCCPLLLAKIHCKITSFSRGKDSYCVYVALCSLVGW